MRYVYNFLDNNPIPSPEQSLGLYQELLPSIQLEELNSLAKKWISETNRVVAISGPEKAESPLPSEDEIRSLLTSVKEVELEPYADEVSDAPLLSVALEPGKIVEETSLDVVGVKEWTLSNGVKVVLKPTDFQNDEILMSATSEGGHSLYGDDKYPSASTATSVVSECGVGDFDVIQLEKKLTGKTVSVNPYISELYEGMNGRVAPEDIETLFQLVYLYFTAPREDADAFQGFITKQKAIYANIMSNPNYYFMNETMKIKYADHPRRSFGDVEQLEKVDMEEALAIYKDRFSDAGDFTFIFVGNFNEEILKSYAELYLANLPATNREETWKDVGADMVDGTVAKSFNMGKAPRTQVDITFHGDAEWSSENRYAMTSMISVLSIKLRESLREDKGGVYGVRVSGNISRIPKERYSINISFNSDPENTQDLIETAMADIKDVMENGIDETYIQKVRETQKQSFITSLESNRFWNSQLEYCYENELDPQNITLEKFEERQKMLTTDLVQEMTNKYFDFDNMIKIVMSPDDTEQETKP